MFNLKTAVGAGKKAQSFDPEPLDAGVAFTLEFGLILGCEGRLRLHQI
ncbi:MAG TPA: hypothetical protein VJ112_04025 [Rhabdochlamydiaceae bacterium]|nr:hypothetical protein [Rhabdochlamydiaceae bacterium]